MAVREKPESGIAPAATAAGKDTFSLISSETLIALYRIMVHCRILADRALAQGKPGASDSGSAIGQEAALAGVTHDLKSGDSIGPSHCAFIPSFLQGAKLERFLDAPPVKPARGQSSRRSSILPSKPSVSPSSRAASELRAALRTAGAHREKKTGSIVVALLHGRPSPPNAWSQALKSAGKQGLPIVFVCIEPWFEDGAKRTNPLEEQSILARTASACRIASIAVDSIDAVAVYRVAHEAIARARAGRGPTLIECVPYRLAAGKSRATSSRMATPEQAPADPICNMEAYLRHKGLLPEKVRREIASECARRPNTLIAAAPSRQRKRRARTAGIAGLGRAGKATRASQLAPNS